MNRAWHRSWHACVRCPARTLRRQRRREGTTFRLLLIEAQRSTAQLLLQHTEQPITEVALRIGFSDSAALARAVRRWFSRSPGELRREAAIHPRKTAAD